MQQSLVQSLEAEVNVNRLGGMSSIDHYCRGGKLNDYVGVELLPSWVLTMYLYCIGCEFTVVLTLCPLCIDRVSALVSALVLAMCPPCIDYVFALVLAIGLLQS